MCWTDERLAECQRVDSLSSGDWGSEEKGRKVDVTSIAKLKMLIVIPFESVFQKLGFSPSTYQHADVVESETHESVVV